MGAVKRWLLLGLCTAAVLVVAQAGEKAKQDNPRAPQERAYQRVTDPAQYVGSDTCQGCHEDVFRAHQRGPHWRTRLLGKGPAWEGCEGCHGPGKEHAESGGDVSKIFRFKEAPAEEASARCLDCHQFSEEHANFQRSVHFDAEIGCAQCHSIHKPKTANKLLAADQPQLCYGCHLDKKAEFAKPFRHRVNEKLVACSDCHNPHGGFLTQQLRATPAQDAVCFQCHTEKTGPFVFEHAPVKTEGCTSCHTPHGSSNPRLLTRSQVNTLCLECTPSRWIRRCPASPPSITRRGSTRRAPCATRPSTVPTSAKSSSSRSAP